MNSNGFHMKALKNMSSCEYCNRQKKYDFEKTNPEIFWHRIGTKDKNLEAPKISFLASKCLFLNIQTKYFLWA